MKYNYIGTYKGLQNGENEPIIPVSYMLLSEYGKSPEQFLEDISQKVSDEIMEELKDLDKEKVKDIAQRKIALLKVKCEELVEFAKEKGTPVVEKASKEVKKKTLAVLKDVEKKLEG